MSINGRAECALDVYLGGYGGGGFVMHEFVFVVWRGIVVIAVVVPIGGLLSIHD